MGMVSRVHRAVWTILAALLLVGALGLIGYEQGISSLALRQTIEPERIFLKGSGVSPEVATVTLQLEAPGREEHLKADVMIVIDRSASFELDQAAQAALRIVDLLGPDDRVGLVSFATEGRLDVRLTPVSEAKSIIQGALARLVDEGKTALGEGIAVATSELVRAGRSEAALLEILLTDGRTNFGRDPLEEARRAAEQNVIIHAVGVGRFVNRDLLTQIAELTGGQFFPAFSDAIVDQIRQVTAPIGQPLATRLEITETLSKGLQYEEALENPPTRVTRNADGTTTLLWQLSELQAGESWMSRYTVSGSEVGIFSLHRSPSSVQYRDFRGRLIQRDLGDLRLEVRPRPPRVRAEFRFTPTNPTSLDVIQFTDQSTVEQGQITSWLWDFGDGTTSTERNPTHRYAADGQYVVRLTVTSDQGVEEGASVTITVATPRVTARRLIDTFIPVDETIPGQTFRVRVDLQVTVRLNGLGLDENVPEGWTVKPIENSSAELRLEDAQWLFSEVLEPGTVKTILYEVTVPSNQRAGTFRIDGTVSSASPQLSLPVTGDTQIEVLSGFPIPVVVAHWDASTQALDLRGYPTHKINLNQILQAISWWREGSEVPFTEDEAGRKQKIDFKAVQQLVAYWLTDTSVFDSLPQE